MNELLGDDYDADWEWVEDCPTHGTQAVEEAVDRPLVVLVCGCEIESRWA